MAGTMTDLQMICHFIISCPSVTQNNGMDLFIVLCGSGLLPHHSASVTPMLLFLNWSVHSYTLCFGQALFSCNAESLWWTSAHGTPSAPKIISLHISLFLCIQQMEQPY